MKPDTPARWQAILRFDQEITSRFQLKSKAGWASKAAALLAHSGDSWFWATGVGLAWLYTSGEIHQKMAVLEIAIIFQALFVFALKKFIRRPRPEGAWGGIYSTMDQHSFPSGHATRAAMLVVLAVGLNLGWFAGLVCLWAPLMALSRVLAGVHYLSDIAGGLVLGLLLGALSLAAAPLWMDALPFLF